MDRFQFDEYLIRRKVLKLLGASFHIYAGDEHQILYANLKAFKLKEDLRIYTGEDMQEEVLKIKARNVLDISATYDIYDSETGARLGSLRRRGMKSLMKDEWLFLDEHDKPIGKIQEDSLAMALIRRVVTGLIPQTYEAEVNGVNIGTYKQNVNPFVTKIKIDFEKGAGEILDKRVGLAAGLLLCAIDGKQH